MPSTRSNMAQSSLARKAISTRSQCIQENIVTSKSESNSSGRNKRKADVSPLKNEKVKRSALGNLTNSVFNIPFDEEQQQQQHTNGTRKNTNFNDSSKSNKKSLKMRNENTHSQTYGQGKLTQNNIVLRNKIVTRAAANKISSSSAGNLPCIPLAAIQNQLFASAQAAAKLQQKQKQQQSDFEPPKKKITQPKNKKNDTVTIMKAKECLEVQIKPATRRISNEFEKTEDSLYMSALEDVTSSQESIRFSGNFELGKRKSLGSNNSEFSSKSEQLDSIAEHSNSGMLSINNDESIQSPVPSGVIDFDKENWDDPFQVSHYAYDIFKYMKQRESKFKIDDYILRQTHLNVWMRSLLVDWMVEVQETFELNHETLYLAVKLVDLYLCQVVVEKDKLQLLGAASLFIACKFDERTPPLVDDFLYICDGAYKHKELTKMEMDVLKRVDYDLGIPLSYRFLRRYARCAKVPMPTLTLARYILEFSLMDYATVTLSDSQLACAALFIALKMANKSNRNSPWNKTLEYYTGYTLEEFGGIILILNSGLHRKPRESTKTIRQKYSHQIFFEVACIPLLSTSILFENTKVIGRI